MLTLARGDTLAFRVKLRRTDGRLLRPADDAMVVSVGAWGPGSDRDSHPDRRVTCEWDGRDWLAELPTGDWEPGTWQVSALAAGIALKGTSRQEIVIS